MDTKCGFLSLNLFGNIFIYTLLISLVFTGFIDGTEPTVVQCNNTIVWLDAVEGYVAVILDNGSANIFDSLGREVSYFDIDLDLPEFEMVDDPTDGPRRRVKGGAYDRIQLIPSKNVLLVFKNTYDFYASGKWGLIKNSVRNLFKGNSTLEMYDWENKGRLFACEYSGWGMSGIVNNPNTMVAFISFINESTWLQVVSVRDGDKILREETTGNSFFAFDSTTFHIYTSNMVITYDIIGSDSLGNRRTENLDFEIHPLLVYRPYFKAEEKYIIFDKTFTGDLGAVKCFGNDSLYERCLESIFAPSINPVMPEVAYSEVLNDYRLLIYRRAHNKIEIANFESGVWCELSAADYLDSDAPPFYAILTSNKYIACNLLMASEFYIIEFELPKGPDH